MECNQFFHRLSIYTSREMKFSYTVHGSKIQADWKNKTIMKTTVLLFIDQVLEMKNEGKKITGSKKIGTFGASYLYSIFMRIGLFGEVPEVCQKCEVREYLIQQLKEYESEMQISKEERMLCHKSVSSVQSPYENENCICGAGVLLDF